MVGPGRHCALLRHWMEQNGMRLRPLPYTHCQLSDLVRDLGLSQQSSEIVASRISEHNILDPENKITFHCERDEMLIQFFAQMDDFVYCNNIEKCILCMGLPQYQPDG